MSVLSAAVATELSREGGTVGIPMFEGSRSDSPAEGLPLGLDSDYCDRQGFSGGSGRSLAAPGPQAMTVVALGLGRRAELSGEQLRLAGAALVRAAGTARQVTVDLRGTDLGGLGPAQAAGAFVEGAALAAHRFPGYRSSPREAGGGAVAQLTVVVGTAIEAEAGAGVARGRRVAEAVGLARDLADEPAEAMTPRRLAEVAGELAGREDLSITVWDEEDIAEEGLGGLAGVARGSDEPPRLLRLIYEPEAAGDHVPTVALVGKGITFDSGGLSIKSREAMMTQKTDMTGGAVVLATMSALRDLGVATRVVGIVPATENLPGPRAVKPGDVLRTRNAKTIEVLNTDAEGRLVLADGLALAVEGAPDAMVDLATLTGACVTALGSRIAGLMGNHEPWMAQVRSAADRAGERVWPLPLPADYRSELDSEVADMRNVAASGAGGALMAGLVLAEFVGTTPWAHLDIAGPARSVSDEGYLHKGGTGFGVRTMLELLSRFEVPPSAS